MKLLESSTEELNHNLSRMKEELEEIKLVREELPAKIEVLKEKKRKKKIAFLNAEGWLEDDMKYLEGVISRIEQVEEIIENINGELKRREVK